MSIPVAFVVTCIPRNNSSSYVYIADEKAGMKRQEKGKKGLLRLHNWNL